jgi:uncharacterized Zn-finger protein
MGVKMKSSDENVPASTQKQYQVTSKDLPLSCPMPNMILWDSHPRVYLPIEKTGKATCPYCGSTYTLTDFHQQGAHHL